MLLRRLAALRTQGQPQPASTDQLVCPLQAAHPQEAHIYRYNTVRAPEATSICLMQVAHLPEACSQRIPHSALQVARLQEALSDKEQALAHSEQAGSQEKQRLQGQCQQLQEQVRTLAHCCLAVSCCCGAAAWTCMCRWGRGAAGYSVPASPVLWCTPKCSACRHQHLQLVGSFSCLLLPACLPVKRWMQGQASRHCSDWKGTEASSSLGNLC